jgi:hypothetical protein
VPQIAHRLGADLADGGLVVAEQQQAVVDDAGIASPARTLRMLDLAIDAMAA